MADRRRRDHLPVIQHPDVARSHRIVVFVVLVGHDYHVSVPSLVVQLLADVAFGIRTLVHGDHSVVFISSGSVGRQRSWVRIFQLELLNSLTNCIHAEHNLILFVSRCEESDMSIFWNLMFRSEFRSNLVNGLLNLNSEVLFAHVDCAFSKELGQILAFRIDVSQGFVSTVLANEFRGELETVLSVGLEVGGEMDVINVFQRPLLHILLEAGEVMSNRHVIGRSLISI